MKRPVKSAKTREYTQFLGTLKQRIALARLSAARAANRDLILLYWDIGRGIVEKQEELGWGESLVELLSRDLQQALPGLTGFSAFNCGGCASSTLCIVPRSFWHSLSQ